jgi:hypothetical protein
MKLRKYLEEKVSFGGKDIGFKKYPKGWDRSSVQKFAKSISGDPSSKGWFDKCVEKMKGKLDNPQAFCAAARDEAKGTTKWRGEHKE